MPGQGAAPRHTTAHSTRTAVPIRRNVSFTLKTTRHTIVPARVPVSLVHAQRLRQCVNSNTKRPIARIHSNHNVHDEQQRLHTQTGTRSHSQCSAQKSCSFPGQVVQSPSTRASFNRFQPSAESHKGAPYSILQYLAPKPVDVFGFV